MKVIRPIHLDDLDRFEEIVFQSSIGLTSLPKDRNQLYDRIVDSNEAFDEKKVDPHHFLYVFVMEDLETNVLIGTCGIKAKTAVTEPMYSYRIETLDNLSPLEHIPKTLKVLSPMEHHHGPSEVCGLFLDPNCRKSNLGYLLSYSRFLFMANHPRRFTDTVIAEMRGHFDENNESLFWNRVGRNFYDVSYKVAVQKKIESSSCIPDFIPKHPIYIGLLPKEVQEVIGRTHQHTEAAISLLQKIGFSLTDEVDIFDAGPKITAQLHDLTPVKESCVNQVAGTSDDLPEEKWIIANTRLDYRACIGSVQPTPGGIMIQNQVCEALDIDIGDDVRYFKL